MEIEIRTAADNLDYAYTAISGENTYVPGNPRVRLTEADVERLLVGGGIEDAPDTPDYKIGGTAEEEGVPINNAFYLGPWSVDPFITLADARERAKGERLFELDEELRDVRLRVQSIRRFLFDVDRDTLVWPPWAPYRPYGPEPYNPLAAVHAANAEDTSVESSARAVAAWIAGNKKAGQ